MDDDLMVARRAYAQALVRIARLQQGLDRTRRHIKLIERKLKEPEPPPTNDLLRALFYLEAGLGRSDERSIRGVQRPSTPPAPPEDVGAVATICRCRSWLRNAEEVHQHWETGCFDQPEYEAPTPPWNPELPVDASDGELQEIKQLIESLMREAWIKGSSTDPSDPISSHTRRR